MVYSRNLIVIALIGVLVGVLASIGTLQYAQVIAFSGMNPNAAQQEQGISKQVRSCVNPRSIMESLFSGLSKQRPCPDVQEEGTIQEMHGAPTVIEPEDEECAAITNPKRRAACNGRVHLRNP